MECIKSFIFVLHGHFRPLENICDKRYTPDYSLGIISHRWYKVKVFVESCKHFQPSAAIVLYI